MSGRDSKPPSRHSLDVPYSPGDTIPAPEAIEKDGESVWALFSEISHQHDNRFADTAPASGAQGLSASEAPGWAATRPMPRGAALPGQRPRPNAQPLFTLEAAMLVARRNNRVCP
ncbi:MAG TPA: hypothetical protein VIL30_17115, partial [Ramlibacter sp.]